ncbi:MAG: hypothetical protein ACOC2U_03515 [bacterium]
MTTVAIKPANCNKGRFFSAKAFYKSRVFAVNHKYVGGLREKEGYTITHIKTALRIGCFDQLNDAINAAKVLENCSGINWDRKKTEFCKQDAIIAKGIVENNNGVLD